MTEPAGVAGSANRPREQNRVVPWLLRTAPPLAGFWLVLSGHFEPLFLGLGVVSVVVVCWICGRAGLADESGASVAFVWRLPRYVLWLGKEMLVSSVAVVRRVWSPRPQLRPVVASTPTGDLPELSQVVYANSITLTPGTLSLRLVDDRIEVHSLDQAGVDTVNDGAMLQQVRRLEANR